jgi:putative hemolysin
MAAPDSTAAALPSASMGAALPNALLTMLAILAVAMFFSLSETALFSLQKADREALKEDARIGTTVTHLLSRPRRLLASLLLGNEIANVALSTVSASLLALTVSGAAATWLNVLVLAPVLILFGDVLPKTLGLRYARTVASVVARPLAFWHELTAPVRAVLSFVVESLLRLVGVRPPPEQESIQEEQLRSLIDQGREAGVVQPIEQEIIHRVFEFGDLPVSRLMTPRPDMFSLSLTTPWTDLFEAIRTARYSRVPMWQGSPDNVVGVLLVKDLLRLRGQPPLNARQLQKMLHPATFVPPSKRAQDLLREFRARGAHLAMVVDEHGSLIGLITLDDLLTELVGEVLDESDVEESEAHALGPNVWSVRAAMDIDDFANRFDHPLPEGDYTTVGGFVFHLLGRAPQKGDEVTWEGVTFLVSGVDGRRITEVTVTFPVSAQPEESRP